MASGAPLRYTGAVGILARLMANTARLKPLTRARRRTAYGVAIGVDVLQLALGPLGWAGADELLDLVAAGVMWRLLGFHPLLLPTFMIELLPITDMLPTWTGCVAIVTASQPLTPDEPPPPGTGDVIEGEVVRRE
jgi:hypothetical protein